MDNGKGNSTEVYLKTMTLEVNLKIQFSIISSTPKLACRPKLKRGGNKTLRNSIKMPSITLKYPFIHSCYKSKLSEH